MKDIIVFVGPAGSGKSTLTACFGSWLTKTMDFPVSYVNLDPGCEYLPYTPDFDVRELISINKIMKKEKLGPNGAYLRSMDIMYEKREEIIRRIEKLEGLFILIDTPGQMELFVFKDTGPALLDLLKNIGRVAIVVVFDLTLVKSASGYAILNLLGLVVQLRLKTESVFVINKSDLLSREFAFDIENIEQELLKEEVGLMADLAASCAELVKRLSRASRIVAVSAKEGEGMDQLYDLLHEIWCTCGDLT